MIDAQHVQIRQPRYEDAAPIAGVHVRAWKQAYMHLLPNGFFTEDHARSRIQQWSRILSAPSGEWSVSVAEAAGEIVGFAMADPVHVATGVPGAVSGAVPRSVAAGAPGADQPSVRELYMLYVLDSHHGTGTGRALLDATVSHDPVSLWVAKQNPRAIRFYQRNGFVFTGEEKSDPSAPAITDARMFRSERSVEARKSGPN